MLKEFKAGKSVTPFLLGFILLHVAVFFVSFTVFRTTPTVDLVEAFYWGKEWQPGYHKHPPLSGWVAEAFASVFGASMATGYLIMAVIIATSMLGCYLIARRFMPPYRALFCVLLLEGIAAATVAGRVFNADTVQIPFWVFGLYFYLRGVEENKPLHWAMFGLSIGLAVLGKYFSLIIAFSLFCSFFSLGQTRRLLKTPWPWLAILVFGAVISPHIYWVFKNDFATLSYGLRTAVYSVKGSLKFAGSCAGAVALCFVLFGVLNNFSFKLKPPPRLSEPKARALLAASIMPFLLTTVVAFFEPHVRVNWSFPMFFFLPICLMHFYEDYSSEQSAKNMVRAVIVLLVLWQAAAFWSGVIRYAPFKPVTPFVKDAARTLPLEWRQKYGEDLKYVVGTSHNAGAFAMFARPRPSVFPCGEQEFAPYIPMQDLLASGFIGIEYSKIKDFCDPEQMREFFLDNGGYIVREKDWKDKKGEHFMRIYFIPPKNINTVNAS